MSNLQPPRDEPQGGPSRGGVGDDFLPPVEPPSAGFIIQLFVVPALIVLVIVLVWLSFSWLVRRTSPEALIQGLEQGPSVARWQRASELADVLRNPRYADFKHDAQAANQLAAILDRAIDQATAGNGMSEEEVTLRYFLAKALGEFEVPEGVNVLVKAAATKRSDSERLVRQGALEALAVRAYNLRQLDPPQVLSDQQLMPMLSDLASDEDAHTRSQAAFSLGQIGTPESLERLEVMVDDPHPETRYNAAMGLAHHGNAKAVETLAEMLDLEELASAPRAAANPQDVVPSAVLVGNALRAIEALAQQNPQADLTVVEESLEKLAAADSQSLEKAALPTRAASDARRVLAELKSGDAKAEAEGT